MLPILHSYCKNCHILSKALPQAGQRGARKSKVDTLPRTKNCEDLKTGFLTNTSYWHNIGAYIILPPYLNLIFPRL